MNRNITATILIILAIGIYFTVTEKIIEDAKTVQAVNSEYKLAIESAKKLINVRDQVLQDYNSISETDRQRLSQMIPNSVDNIRLIIELNNVAMRHGFSLQNIEAKASPSTPSAAPIQIQAPGSGGYPGEGAGRSIATPILDTVMVTFEVTAPYLQFISFLQDIEANLRIMDITDMSMIASDSGLYTFKVGLKTYWLRQQ